MRTMGNIFPIHNVSGEKQNKKQRAGQIKNEIECIILAIIIFKGDMITSLEVAIKSC